MFIIFSKYLKYYKQTSDYNGPANEILVLRPEFFLLVNLRDKKIRFRVGGGGGGLIEKKLSKTSPEQTVKLVK